jgi:hypothetical protein
MDKPLLVGVVQRLGNGSDKFGCISIFEPLLFQFRREIGAFDVLGDNVTGTFFRAANIMHRHNTGMIEIGDRASLGQIRLGIFGFGDQFGVRHLDGDQPIQLLVVGQLDKAKATFAQYLLDAIATNLCERMSRRSLILRDRVPVVILRHFAGVGIVQACCRFRRICRSWSSPWV